MISETAFDFIDFNDEKIALRSNVNKDKEFFFEEVTQIYISKIKTYTTSVIFSFSFIIVVNLVAILGDFIPSDEPITYFVLTSMVFILLVLLLYFIFRYKEHYEINILLKNGDTFKSKFPSKFKNENTMLINQIKQKIFDYKMQRQTAINS